DAAGEEVVADLDPSAITLRISMPMGISYNSHAGAVDWIASRFRADRPASLFYDEVRTPTYGDEMARVFREFLANDYAGILNCGGPRQVSLYKMAQIINRAGGFDGEKLFGMYAEEYCPVPPRVRNCAMDSSKLARVLGYQPFTPWPGFGELTPCFADREWHKNERRAPGEPGSIPYMNRTLGFSPSLYRSREEYLQNLF
ncbi:MAG: sugar nucleotide-binding protein, partial [Thermoguttaceae bacterium]|nr:sugar nucleotide-binding protein [Thermoguttaceae bacterium]